MTLKQFFQVTPTQHADQGIFYSLSKDLVQQLGVMIERQKETIERLADAHVERLDRAIQRLLPVGRAH